MRYQAPEDLENCIKRPPAERIKRLGHILKDKCSRSFQLVRQKALALRPTPVSYYSLWRMLARFSPIVLLLLFVASYVHVHPERVEKAGY
ncbi:hypothetical protein AAVH_08172 [Aphelenchoides avenae]|nr:hypothetical protein AAVH_08172 [Aphelenchus avenae]